MKKYLFGILAIAMAVGFSAFTTKKVHKPFSPVTYYYIQGTANQRLEPGFIGAGAANTIKDTKFKDVANWTTTSYAFTVYGSDGSSYIHSITFNLDGTPGDGDNDQELSLQEALNALFTEYLRPTPDFMPASFLVDADANGTGATITVEKSDNVQ